MFIPFALIFLIYLLETIISYALRYLNLNHLKQHGAEIPQNFETFDGDDPDEPELVNIDGAWKAGRERDNAGMLVLANPQVGEGYREEVSLGEAEDVAEVISITGTESVPATQCANDCVVTRNFTALEPGVNELKHYKAGVGLILEVESDGTRIELVEFTIP